MDDSLWFSLLFTLFIQSFSTIEHQVFFALVNFAERRSEHSGFSSKKFARTRLGTPGPDLIYLKNRDKIMFVELYSVFLAYTYAQRV